MAKYQKVKDGIFYNDKVGRIVEHRGYSTRIFWNKQMLDYLRNNFATTLNEDLADWLGVHKRTMIRKARELGLEKDPQWLRGVHDGNRKLANQVARIKGHPGAIKPGEHRSLATEYKKGHQSSEETKAKHRASVIEWNRRHPDKVRQRIEKAANTRKRNQLIKISANV